MRLLKRCALAAALLYATLLAFAFFAQRSLLYSPSHDDQLGRGNALFQPWHSLQGEFLGYLHGEQSHPRRVVVFFHGIGGEALNWSWYARLVPADELLVLAEYPGYGARAGSPAQRTIFASAVRLVDDVKAHWRAPITIVGESLGSSVACYVASRRGIDRMALVSPFSSVLDVAVGLLPFLPVRLLLTDRFPSAHYVTSVEVPLFMIHGSKDRIVPTRLARKLYSIYAGKQKTYVELPGVDHVTINHALLYAAAAQGYRDFLAGTDLETVATGLNPSVLPVRAERQQ